MDILVRQGVPVTDQEVRSSNLVQNWRSGMYSGWGPGWTITGITVHHVLRIPSDGPIRMLFIEVDTCHQGRKFTRSIVLRGASVDILSVLIAPDGAKFTTLVGEERPALGMTMLANAAGMVDFDEHPRVAAWRELGEEVSEKVQQGRLISLNEKLFGDEQTPLYVSPGTTDEIAFLYANEKHMSYEQIRALHGYQAGLAAEGEFTTVHVVPLSEALSVMSKNGRPCLKATASLLAYQM